MAEAHRHRFKLMLEGVKVPFLSTMISETSDGVFAHVALFPHEKIYDLRVGTLVQIFFKDHSTNIDALKENKSGKENNRWQWRLCFDGEFRGFETVENAALAGGITILCKCMRNQYRRNTVGMLFSSAFGAPATTTLFKEYGLKKISGPFAVKAAGDNNLNNVKAWIQGVIKAHKGNGSNMEVATVSVFTNIWYFTQLYNPIIRTVNARHKMIRKFVAFRNAAGYRAFAADRTSLGQTDDYQALAEIIGGSSALCTINTMIERIGNHYRFFTFHMGSPAFVSDISKEKNIVSTDDRRVDKYGDFAEGTNKRLTSMFIAPLLAYTAPPRCNILYPILYNQISYSLDYDNDLTRGIGSIMHALRSQAAGQQTFGMRSFVMPMVGRYGSLTPVTMEEYDKGVTPYTSAMSSKYIGRSLRAEFKDGKEKLKKEQDRRASQTGESKDSAHQAISWKDTRRKLLAYEMMYKKYMQRQASIRGPFNPYATIGFPMVVVAENDKVATVQVPKSMIGFLVQKVHTINAQAGEASTIFSLTHFRPVNEPTDMDDYGQPLFSATTDREKSKKDVFESTIGKALYNVADNFAPKGKKKKGKPADDIDRDTSATLDGTAVKGETKGVKYELNPEYFEGLEKNEIINYSESRRTYEKNFRIKYPYANDFLDYAWYDIINKRTKKVVETKILSVPGPWLDGIYLPQYVGSFYRRLFFDKQEEDLEFSIMGWPDRQVNKSVYDTIHEAVEKNIDKNNEFEYLDAINDIWRPICTESQFYLGIMDAITADMSIKRTEGAVPTDADPEAKIEAEPYPNFDEDQYVSYPDYSTHLTYEEFIDNEDVAAGNGDRFNDDGTIDFSHDNGRCFDSEKEFAVKDYLEAISNLPTYQKQED